MDLIYQDILSDLSILSCDLWLSAATAEAVLDTGTDAATADTTDTRGHQEEEDEGKDYPEQQAWLTLSLVPTCSNIFCTLVISNAAPSPETLNNISSIIHSSGNVIVIKCFLVPAVPGFT